MMAERNPWQIRCLTCGAARNAEDAGIIRVGAVGRKYTLGWCSRCRWLRRCVIEQVPRRGFEVVVPLPPTTGGPDGPPAP